MKKIWSKYKEIMNTPHQTKLGTCTYNGVTTIIHRNGETLYDPKNQCYYQNSIDLVRNMSPKANISFRYNPSENLGGRMLISGSGHNQSPLFNKPQQNH